MENKITLNKCAVIRVAALLPFILLVTTGSFGNSTQLKSEFLTSAIPEANQVRHPSENIQFTEEVVYSEPEGLIFGTITSAATGRDGQVYMADHDQGTVHMFDPDGSYLRSFGRSGDGPGEFRMISKILAGEDYIHVFDMMMGRVTLFDTESFKFIRTVSLAEGGGVIRRNQTDNQGLGRPFDLFLLPGGNYLVIYRSFGSATGPQTAIVSPQGEVLEKNRFPLPDTPDQVAEQTSGNMRVVMNFPFSRSTGLALSPPGLLYTNWSEELKFDLYDESGNHIRSFSHNRQNAPLIRSELLDMYENVQTQGVVMGAGGGGQFGGAPRIQEMLRNIELPETWPAVDNMYADSLNRLWVSSFTENTAEREWHLFDESGELLGTFRWPSSRSVIYAGRNTVYVLDRPGDDLPKVMRLGFTL